MDLSTLLAMAVSGMSDRVAVGSGSEGLTYGALGTRVARAADFFRRSDARNVVLIDQNSEALPIALFAAAACGKPFVPLNYRLPPEQLLSVLARTAPALVIAGDHATSVTGVDGVDVVSRTAFLDIAAGEDRQSDGRDAGEPTPAGPEDVAVMLFTSGTTGQPKAAILRHRHLATYIFSTVEFASADETEAAIITVPPYHVAGLSAVLSNGFAGRRIVYLENFDPDAWIDTVDAELATHAMVVPTMLRRVIGALPAHESGLPSLRSLSYGGGPMPLSVIREAMRLLPQADFVNAYGLTETSSTIALLGPTEHREAYASSDPSVAARLQSVGRPLPTVEVSIRNDDEQAVPVGTTGEIWVRGEQVSGEYAGVDGTPGDGWFRTRDAGHVDAAGYLYVHGRLDDVIVRGGENLSPGEIEDVLVSHETVADAAVVGVPDTEWGERVVAAVVPVSGSTIDPDELRSYVRSRLKSTKTPEDIAIRDHLPYNETGKLLRRVLRHELSAPPTDRVPPR